MIASTSRMAMLVTTTLSLICAAAALDPVATAERSLAELDFGRSAEQSMGELKRGQLSPEQAQRAWAVRAQALGAQGFADDARVAFERALSLLPSFEVSPDASPKLSVPFQKARARMEGRRLAARSVASLGADRTAGVEIEVIDDLTGLISRAEVISAGQVVPMVRLATQFSARISCEAPCHYQVVLRDDFGNRVLELGSAKAPLIISRPNDTPVAGVTPALVPSNKTPEVDLSTSPGTPIYKQPLPWLIGAGAAAIAGTVFAVRFSNDVKQLRQFDAQRSDTTVAQLRSTESSARVNQGLTGGLFAASLALAGVGVWVW